MKKFVLVLGAMAIVGCSETEEAVPEEVAGMEQMTATGAFILDYADGSRLLTYTDADGTQVYSDLSLVGTWEATETGACFNVTDTTEEDAEEVRNCTTSAGEVGEDGSYTVSYDEMPPASWRRLDRELVPGESVSMEAGVFEGTLEDGTNVLAVGDEDGDFYAGTIMGTGTWQVIDGKRCGTPDDPEMEAGCGVVGEVAEDGNSWTAIPDEGEPFTVTRIL